MFKKGLLVAALAVAIAMAGLAFAAFDGHEGATAAPGPKPPSGKHFTLNLIANTDKNANMNNAGGSVIFVPLQCQQKGPKNSPDPQTCNETDGVALDADCRIDLKMGDFQVLDKNCTDGLAQFQLPDPCATDQLATPVACTETAYSVWIALAGKPGGGMDMETCFHDTATNTDVCSLENVIRFRTNGKPSWSDVSKCLLTVYTVATGRDFIFSPEGSAFWWEYDNWGNRLAKLRFYPTTTSAITNPGIAC
jgi:hypothetical protein